MLLPTVGYRRSGIQLKYLFWWPLVAIYEMIARMFVVLRKNLGDHKFQKHIYLANKKRCIFVIAINRSKKMFSSVLQAKSFPKTCTGWPVFGFNGKEKPARMNIRSGVDVSGNEIDAWICPYFQELIKIIWFRNKRNCNFAFLYFLCLWTT